MWPLKGSAMPLTCRPTPSAAEVEIDGQWVAHLRDARAVQIETLVVGAGILVVGSGDVARARTGASRSRRWSCRGLHGDVDSPLEEQTFDLPQ
jgi:hypothetical protein